MDDSLNITFKDTVKKIWKTENSPTYTVIFRRMAAFYNIDETKEQEIELLKQSEKESLPLKVLNNTLKSEIMEVSPA